MSSPFQSRFGLRALATPLLRVVALFAFIGLLIGGADTAARAQEATDRPVSVWTKRTDYAGLGESGSHIALDKVGNVIVACTAGYAPGDSNWLIVKYNGVTGAILWQKFYTGGNAGLDRVAGLAVDASNNVIVVGSADGGSDMDGPRGLDFTVVKYNGASGAVLWQYKEGIGEGIDDYIVDVALDAAGNVYFVGAAGGETATDMVTYKIAGANGAFVWNRIYSDTFDDVGNHIAVTPDGASVYVTGRTDARALPADPVKQDIYIARYSGANGAVIWEKFYDYEGETDDPTDIGLDGQGSVYVVGQGSDGLTADVIALRFLAGTGALVWEKTFDSSPNINEPTADYPRGMHVDPNSGGLYVVGAVAATENSDMLVIRFNLTDGAVAWTRREDYRSNANEGYQIVTDGANGVYVVGAGIKTNATPPAEADANSLIYRFDIATGALQWVTSRSGLPNGLGFDLGESIAVNPANRDVFVSGSDSVPGTPDPSRDLAVAKYSQPTLRPFDVSASGGDGKTRVLWRGTDNQSLTLWTVAATGVVELGKKYGLPAGYTLTKMTVGQTDNKVRLLLTRTSDKQAVIWTFSANLMTLETGYTFAAPGYKPVDLTISPTDNKIRLVWSNLTDNRAAVWTLNAAGTAPEVGRLFAPPSDPTDFIAGIAVGYDGRTRLLWRTVSGAGFLWTLNASGSGVSVNYPLVIGGYKPTFLAAPMGADNKPRIVWTGNADGRIRLVTYVTTGNALSGASYNYGPYAGANVVGATINKADNKPRLLWNYTDAKAAFWQINPATGAIELGKTFGPYY